MKKIIVFASGSGSNAENIFLKFKEDKTAEIASIFTNNPKAMVIERAKKLQIPCFVFDKNALNEGGVLEEIQKIKPDLIVLAGFLWMFPAAIIAHYPNKVVNIHPALLPNYGGKGMYGMRVHESVLANKEQETGITIHYVNEKYDEGAIVFQAKTDISACTTADEIAHQIHELEYKHFPEVLLNLLK